MPRATEGRLEQMLEVTLATLDEVPDLDAVHAASDSPSRGVVTALKERGRWRKTDEDGHVVFVNIDGEPISLNWIREGYMDACVSQDPVAYGEIAVEIIEKYSLEGRRAPIGPYENETYFWRRAEIIEGETGPTMVIPPFVIDRGNVEDERHWGHVSEKVWGLAYS